MTIVTKKPVLRVLHHMARSGGTVISRCLGCMDDVVLLSEIHPFGTSVHNPVLQAAEWFHVFTEKELQEIKQRAVTFLDAIELIRRRVESSGRYLVVRDWTHLDFTGVPFLKEPSYRLTTSDVLRENYRVIQAASVRHPVDQWISLNKLDMFKHASSSRLRLDAFIRGYLKFAEHAIKMGYVRYEDFTQDSDVALQALCRRLQIPFDGGYQFKWAEYDKITGDNTTPSESRFVGQSMIQALPRQPVDGNVIEGFRSCPDYHKVISMLGYQEEI